MKEERFLINTKEAAKALRKIEKNKDSYTDATVLAGDVQDAVALIQVAIVDTSADVAQDD